ncbi:MAG TPA: hypothetical protein VN668_09655 [Stellaceae bacterium]|nr:hypothetical protein [Stellaceae bacterium]
MAATQSGDALTLAIAADIVKDVEARFARADIASIVTGFTEDAVARFGDFPEMRDRAAIERLLRARFARQRR